MPNLSKLIVLKEAILSSTFDNYTDKEKQQFEKNKDEFNAHKTLIKSFSDNEIFIVKFPKAYYVSGYYIVDLFNSLLYLSPNLKEVLKFIEKYKTKLNLIKRVVEIKSDVENFFNLSSNRYSHNNVIVSSKLRKNVSIKNNLIQKIHSIGFDDGEFNSNSIKIFKSLTEAQKMNLSSLSFRFSDKNELTDLDFSQCKNLKTFSIYESSFLTNIKQLKGLDQLTNLTTLIISHTSINKIENLDKLVKLEKLDLTNNNINKIENLDKLVKLEKLDLTNNNINKIENLDKLVKLDRLILTNNTITKIENLDKLVNLSYLELNKNPINKLENLDNLTKLRVVWLNKTNVSEKEMNDFNKKLKQHN